jgi:hypothetical protein
MSRDSFRAGPVLALQLLVVRMLAWLVQWVGTIIEKYLD